MVCVAELDAQEMKMFAKWHGVCDLVNSDDFWMDCMSAYRDKSVTIPLYDTAVGREEMSRLVKCPPGECGVCCGYHETIAISGLEYKALCAVARQRPNMQRDSNGQMYLRVKDGCQYLVDNACSVYAVRPAVCKAFPLVASKDSVDLNGAHVKQLQIRLQCQAALDALRDVFYMVCAEGKVLVLPDLSLVPAYENGHGVLGSI